MKILINYADESYRQYQGFNSKTGLAAGGFDRVIEYSPKDIDQDFFREHSNILRMTRGAGLWLWKPYIILKALRECNDGDYIFYADSGSYFVNTIDHLIECIEKDGTGIMTFDTPLLNIQFADARFIKQLGPGLEEWLYSTQVMGGFILLKNSPSTRAFVEEFLTLCSQEKLLIADTDRVQHEHYIAHREDQTILSYLIWRKGLPTYRDPTQYGTMPLEQIKYGMDKIGLSYLCFKKYENSSYPPIIILYRKKKLFEFFPRKKFEFILGVKKVLLKKLVPL